MQSYRLILFVIIIGLSRELSGSFPRTKISTGLGDKFDHSTGDIEGPDEEWELVEPSDSETDDDSSISTERNEDPIICKICQGQIFASEATYQKTTGNCDHLFHSRCIPRTSKNWGYDCPSCHLGEDSLDRARKELCQQESTREMFQFLAAVLGTTLWIILAGWAGSERPGLR